MTEISIDDLTTDLTLLLSAAEHRQARDAENNVDADIFWEGYQAALHDLLSEIAPESTGALMRRFHNTVVLDVANWETLAAVDTYAAGKVDRAQAIKWLVNMAVAHPTRESCLEGECGG